MSNAQCSNGKEKKAFSLDTCALKMERCPFIGTASLTFLVSHNLRCIHTVLFLCRMRILALLVPAFFIVSCVDASRTVRVTVHSEDFTPGIIHDVTYECDGEIIDDPETVFDSATGTYRLRWDTCNTGEYTVTVTTVFGTEMVQKFDVESDAHLLVKDELPFVPVGFISKDSMLRADTVQFVRVMSGCFTEDLHKTTLVKNADGYEWNEYPVPAFEHTYPRQITAEEGTRLIDAFVESQNEIEQLRLDSAGKLEFSTTRQYVFIRADEQVYSYYDNGMKWVDYPDVYIP